MIQMHVVTIMSTIMKRTMTAGAMDAESIHAIIHKQMNCLRSSQ